MVDLTDTICALSTAPGRSGIALVRLSGPDCFKILAGVFSPARASAEVSARKAVLGRVFDPHTREELDEALVTCFHTPRSYTGEDVAEISVHGSPVVVAHLLEYLCSQGARLAEPGEFTLRAFLHGRMNLAEAEAVRDVIEAHTLYQLQVASRQRSGELSRQLEPLKRNLIDIIVSLETAVEFVEEDLALDGRELLAAKLERILEEVGRWVASFRRGRIVRNGFSLAVVGRPNVGKSSVFNALLAEERSIVTEVPGTTRDVVSEFVSIDGIPVRLMDTAGLREGQDPIEQLGVERSLRALSDVDAILLVLDPSCPWCEEDEQVHERLTALSCVAVFNKSDLPAVWTEQEKRKYETISAGLAVSALTGAGIEDLRRAIHRHLIGDAGRERDGLLITNLRHCQCLEAAQQQLSAAAAALRAGLSEEFVLTDLHRGLRKLGEITGETTVEEILGQIFSRFCIGK
jgi:tRNA modification GTPase